MSTQPRQQSGRPTGGQFASTDRAEADVTLAKRRGPKNRYRLYAWRPVDEARAGQKLSEFADDEIVEKTRRFADEESTQQAADEMAAAGWDVMLELWDEAHDQRPLNRGYGAYGFVKPAAAE